MVEEECESLESDEYGSLMGGEVWRRALTPRFDLPMAGDRRAVPGGER